MPHPGLFMEYMRTQDCVTWKHPAVEILYLQGMLFKYRLNVNTHLGTSVGEAGHIFPNVKETRFS